MKSSWAVGLFFGVLLSAFRPGRIAVAASGDGGINRDAATEMGMPGDAQAPTAQGGNSDQTPLACDGALCATATGGTPCSIAGFGTKRAPLPRSGTLVLSALGLGALGRRMRRERERAR